MFGLKRAVVILAGITAAVAPQSVAAQAPAPLPAQPDITDQAIVGTWIDDEGKGAIEIARCGQSLCGRIVWLKDPLAPDGTPWTDQNNPDKSKRRQPICGLQVIGEVKPVKRGVWDGGWIYDPEEGKAYGVELTARDGQTLQVHGYVAMKVLGETMIWTKASPTLERCQSTPPPPPVR